MSDSTVVPVRPGAPRLADGRTVKRVWWVAALVLVQVVVVEHSAHATALASPTGSVAQTFARTPVSSAAHALQCNVSQSPITAGGGITVRLSCSYSPTLASGAYLGSSSRPEPYSIAFAVAAATADGSGNMRASGAFFARTPTSVQSTFVEACMSLLCNTDRSNWYATHSGEWPNSVISSTVLAQGTGWVKVRIDVSGGVTPGSPAPPLYNDANPTPVHPMPSTGCLAGECMAVRWWDGTSTTAGVSYVGRAYTGTLTGPNNKWYQGHVSTWVFQQPTIQPDLPPDLFSGTVPPASGGCYLGSLTRTSGADPDAGVNAGDTTTFHASWTGTANLLTVSGVNHNLQQTLRTVSVAGVSGPTGVDVVITWPRDGTWAYSWTLSDSSGSLCADADGNTGGGGSGSGGHTPGCPDGQDPVSYTDGGVAQCATDAEVGQCFSGSGIGLNPSSWVPAVGRMGLCVTRWAVVPDRDRLADDVAELVDEAVDSPLGAFVGPVTGFMSGMSTATAGSASGCEGPTVDVPLGDDPDGVQLAPFSSCSEGMSDAASTLKTALRFVIYGGALLVSFRLVFWALGFRDLPFMGGGPDGETLSGRTQVWYTNEGSD